MLIKKIFFFSQFYNTENVVAISEKIQLLLTLVKVEQCYDIYFRFVNHGAIL